MNSRASLPDFSKFDGSDINRLLPPVISLVLVIIIGWQLAKIFWLLIPGAGDVAVVIPAPAATSNTSSSSSAVAADAAKISESHIFGIADEEPAGAELIVAPDDDLADTRLVNLTLNGTVASSIPNYAVAIISDGGKDQEVYKIGESVGNNATLHAVYADRVVLNEKGTLTNLKLPREFSNIPERSAQRQLTPTRQTADNSKSLQAVVAQNLTKLTDVIRPTPYRVQGQQVGYRVYPGRDRRQFAALGLQPGDIIKDIDGQTLSDPSQAMQIFQSLGTAEQVTVTIERGGASETLTLKTSQLDLGDDKTK